MSSSKCFPLKKWWTTQLVLLDPRLGSSAKLLFIRLVAHHNNKTGQCNPSQETLANALSCSTRQVRNLTTELIETGHIQTRKGPEKPSRLHYRLSWFEGTSEEFRKAEKSFLNQRKQSSGKYKKEQKNKRLRCKTEESQAQRSARSSALESKEEIRGLLEQTIVKHFGSDDQAWSMAMQISAEDYSLEVERVVAG